VAAFAGRFAAQGWPRQFRRTGVGGQRREHDILSVDPALVRRDPTRSAELRVLAPLFVAQNQLAVKQEPPQAAHEAERWLNRRDELHDRPLTVGDHAGDAYDPVQPDASLGFSRRG
jgi:hypothetical protein